MTEEKQYIAEIKCLTCKKTVMVEAKKDLYDGRYVITCPKRKKLAYNSKTPPPQIKNRL